MAAPTTTEWELEAHTRAKHEILKRYLQAWVPILARSGYPQVLYIDGFAGPGRYSGGEDGSPIIALRTALEYATTVRATVHFLFVEEKRDRARVLQEIVNDIEIPRRFRVDIEGGKTFEAAFSNLREKQKPLPPTFAFVDPFGWTGAPFSIVKEIMGNRSCEVFVNFMYEEINRFIGHPLQEANFDSFFGTREWRNGLKLNEPRERNRFFHDLYERQLRDEAGVRYVRSFQMRNAADVTDYYLFFATNNLLGLEKMKDAMWAVDESGEFTFSDATDPNQLVLFGKEPRLDVLERQILNRFRGQETTVGEIEHFVLTDTAFRKAHCRRVLKPLESSNPPMFEVIKPPEKRSRGTFASKQLRLRFR